MGCNGVEEVESVLEKFQIFCCYKFRGNYYQYIQSFGDGMKKGYLVLFGKNIFI